jgi:hypothetical protein
MSDEYPPALHLVGAGEEPAPDETPPEEWDRPEAEAYRLILDLIAREAAALRDGLPEPGLTTRQRVQRIRANLDLIEDWTPNEGAPQ